MLFQDRSEGGRLLAAKLRNFANRPDVVVLALPRGGVPVGFEVAKALNVPLDVFVVRKLGVSVHEEVAMGAIGSGGSELCVAVGGWYRNFSQMSDDEVRDLLRRAADFGKPGTGDKTAA